jgi:hypothetical protein
MPLRNESARALARLELEAPFPTMHTCIIYKSKSKTLFVKQSVVIRQNLMSWYRQW